MFWLVSIVAAGVIATLFLLAFRRDRKSHRRAFQLLCDALEADSRADNRATGTREGVPYGLCYNVRRGPFGAAAPSLCLMIQGRVAFGFTILPRNEGEGPHTPAGGPIEVPTGDVDFDREVRLLSDAPQAIEHFFANPVRRRAGRKLIELGASTVRLAGNRIEVIWSPVELTEETDPVRFSAGLSHMLSLALAIPGFLARLPVERKARAGAGRILLRVAPALALVTGAASSVWGARRFPPVDLTALATIASVVGLALLMFLAVTLWALVGSVRLAARQMLAAALISVPGSLLAGLGLCIVLNGLDDAGPLAVRTVSVLSKSNVCVFSFCSAYSVDVISWHRGRKSERFLVPIEIYRRARPGGRLLLTTKPGRLRVEWVREVSELRPGAATGAGRAVARVARQRAHGDGVVNRRRSLVSDSCPQCMIFGRSVASSITPKEFS
jgi:hypothetical protein